MMWREARMNEPVKRSPLLEIDSVTLGYRGASVVNDVSLNVDGGEVVCLLGPNGAGKTTTLSAVSGLVPPRNGDIRYEGQSVLGHRPDQISRAGLIQVPEDRALFRSLTVKENLAVASPDQQAHEEVLNFFPQLRPILGRRAAVLSGGEQQMLTLARALILRPRMLVVDEMSLGLAPIVVSRLLPILRQVVDTTGCGLLLVEQHVHLALEIADRAYVMVRGQVINEGSAAEIGSQLDEIRGQYLGQGVS
ncbi:ABC transporter ATP-binding protein [Georgenia sp. EYE_87]|uniref:ABC transporter ATP-binding protein n=1 Tax=Georgenia sp. EYE_87 TaxID=2853448 RepID=UPI0035A980D1